MGLSHHAERACNDFSILYHGWVMHLQPVAAVCFYFHGVHGWTKMSSPSISRIEAECSCVGEKAVMDRSFLAVTFFDCEFVSLPVILLSGVDTSKCGFHTLVEPRFHASSWRSDRNN